jgi:hypothetical protein
MDRSNSGFGCKEISPASRRRRAPVISLNPSLQWRAANTTIVLIAISLTLMAFLWYDW